MLRSAETLPGYALPGRPTLLSVVALLLAAPLLAPWPAHAQDAAVTAATRILPDVVVTASRVPVPATEVGSAVTVITADQIRASQATFVTDLLRTVPGVTVAQSGPPGSLAEVRIRGAEARHTLVLIDGIEANDVTGGSSFDFSHLLADDVERIEVLRGNQSAVWGSDAIGGVVNIVTRSARKGYRASAFAEGGSRLTAHAGANVSAGNDKADIAAGVAGFRTDGINVSRTGSETDGYSNATANLKGHWRPAENAELTASFRGVRAASRQDVDPNFGPIPADSPDATDRSEAYGRVAGRITLVDGHWENDLSLAWTETANRFNRTPATAFGIDRNWGRKLKGEYRSTFRFATPEVADARHTVTLLVSRDREDYTQHGPVTFFGDPNVDGRITNTGYVGEYRLDLWERLSLSGAVRFDDNDRFRDRATGRLTAAWFQDSTGTRLHASLGSGAKNPTMLDLFGFSTTYVGNPSLSPEKSVGWDAGVEQSLLGDRASVDVTYFRQDIWSEISLVSLASGVSTAINAPGVARAQGVEVAARANPVVGLDLRASYTYTDARRSTGTPTFPGGEAIRRPPHAGSFTADYALPDRRTKLHLGIDYHGSTDDIFFTSRAEEVRLKPYTLVGLGVRYDLGPRVELYARADNLLGETYEDVYGFRAGGRLLLAGIRVTTGP